MESSSHSDRKPRTWAPWSRALVKIATNPTHPEVSPAILKMTDNHVIIKDKYAKARYHVLVVPRHAEIDTASDLTAKDVPLLKEMFSLAKEMIKQQLTVDPTATFRVGFHSSPSMQRIHMHVISTDFDSVALKHPKHWLSFTTDFFLDAAPLIAHLETTGQLPDFPNDPEAEEALDKGALKCPLCKKDFGQGRKGLGNLRLHYHQEHFEKGERLRYPL